MNTLNSVSNKSGAKHKPTEAGIVLFAEEPQAVLPKRTGIKIFRYKTTAQEGTRDTLDGNPRSIDGHAYVHETSGGVSKGRIARKFRLNLRTVIRICSWWGSQGD